MIGGDSTAEEKSVARGLILDPGKGADIDLGGAPADSEKCVDSLVTHSFGASASI